MAEFEDRHYPIRENMKFQHRAWLVERAGWIVLGIVVIAALAGVFGHGILSKTVAGRPPFTVEYERFQHTTRTARYLVHLGAQHQLVLDPAFQSDYQISDIQPRPARSAAGPAGLEFTFDTTGADPIVAIWAKPRRFGVFALDVTSGGERLRLWLLIYP